MDLLMAQASSLYDAGMDWLSFEGTIDTLRQFAMVWTKSAPAKNKRDSWISCWTSLPEISCHSASAERPTSNGRNRVAGFPIMSSGIRRWMLSVECSKFILNQIESANCTFFRSGQRTSNVQRPASNLKVASLGQSGRPGDVKAIHLANPLHFLSRIYLPKAMTRRDHGITPGTNRSLKSFAVLTALKPPKLLVSDAGIGLFSSARPNTSSQVLMSEE